MFETLVPSKIRRALLEHIVVHPHDRFYLRGLARELDLSVSPLRRALKQFERSGLLRSIREANVCFYAVNPASPAFLQLQALQTSDIRGQRSEVGSQKSDVGGQRSEIDYQQSALSIQQSAPSTQHTAAGTRNSQLGTRWWWRVGLQGPALLWVAGGSLTLFVLVTSLGYLGLRREWTGSPGSARVTASRAALVVQAPAPSASGAMRGARWQVIPGAVGGFTASD